MNPLWQDRKVVLCAGTGGVGKTTVSAAIAIAAAASGMRTLVMTIDPARRLANALGLATLGNVEREIPAEALAPYGVELKAPLWAMMPDVKRTFDELIERIVPEPERRQRILRNRFYQQFSTVLAGSLEYAAVEKLYEAHASGRYDLIVLDTPPSQNAVDFLEAPGRLLDFLDNESWQWLLKPYTLAGRFSIKLLDLGGSLVLRTLGRLAGGDVIRELAEFILGFQGTYDGFRERSAKVRALLGSEELAFVLVTSTQSNQLSALLDFRSGLQSRGMRVRAVVANRVRPPVLEAEHVTQSLAKMDQLLETHTTAERQTMRDTVGAELAMSERAARVVAALEQNLEETQLVTLPELPLDAHDLESLAQLHGAFMPTG